MGGGTLNSLLSLPPSHHLLRLNKIKILFQHRGTSEFQLSCRRININIDFFGCLVKYDRAERFFTYQRLMGFLLLKEKMKTYTTNQTW